MSELVKRLSEADSRVVLGDAGLSAAELHTRITRLRTVPLTFPDTRGGTTLDIAVDADRTVLDGADFTAGTGRLHIEGTLTLGRVPVRCTADVDLASRAGTGRIFEQRADHQETV
ncbi:hypothetical protein [Streptomyces sp. NBC_01565]|uniref:hypothetical protein n=1 Tax=unclassified Streptomyces TaxID=2593676 RepID=UPI00225185D5|nr:hypothetical protein [Streptomyces sp. NBC_01565]MCX4539345.1 hypothetical protein [Streptomyces sp. NBC_01565]